jgi:Cu/Zn superoxide dismutase
VNRYVLILGLGNLKVRSGFDDMMKIIMKVYGVDPSSHGFHVHIQGPSRNNRL